MPSTCALSGGDLGELLHEDERRVALDVMVEYGWKRLKWKKRAEGMD